MRIGLLKERTNGEARVALVPETVRRLAAGGHAVIVEPAAGQAAFFADGDYVAAGATIDPVLTSADVVVRIHPPTIAEIEALREGTVLVSLLYPRTNPDLVRALAAGRITAVAADMVPRTALAQSMDVLSSQTTAAGYHAVLLAAAALPKIFPMLMTAAGTIPPAKVLVLGAGVAGLTAIATARRLGAVVEAFDVRRAAKEQVESLGARFVDAPGLADAQGQGGYAREMTDEEKKMQGDAVARHVARADVCITTALVPGRRAPVLITEEMVRAMRQGSVIVDLAAEQGGNCELTKPGETTIRHGVTIIGATNVAARVAVDASRMYSRNMEKLILHLWPDGALAIDMTDEIACGCVITHGGEIIHTSVREGAVA
jgi:NAD(P) transhydrogenase subunit alpha